MMRVFEISNLKRFMIYKAVRVPVSYVYDKRTIIEDVIRTGVDHIFILRCNMIRYTGVRYDTYDKNYNSWSTRKGTISYWMMERGEYGGTEEVGLLIVRMDYKPTRLSNEHRLWYHWVCTTKCFVCTSAGTEYCCTAAHRTAVT